MSTRPVRRSWFAVGGPADGPATAALFGAVLVELRSRVERLDVALDPAPDAPPGGSLAAPPDVRAAHEALVARGTRFGRRRTTLSITWRDRTWPHALAWAPWSARALAFGERDQLVASHHEGAVSALLSDDEAEALRAAVPGVLLDPVPEPPSVWDSLLKRPKRQ